MRKSNVILLLKTFSEEEIKKFDDLLKSPYFNKSKTLIRFYSELSKFYPEFPDDKILKENIHNKTFPGKKFNEQVIKNLNSELLRLIKVFFELELMGTDKNERKINLLKQLVRRKADKIYLSELKGFENELNEQSDISERKFHYLFLLEELKIAYHLERNEQPRVFDKVMKSGEHLILYFHLHFIKTISNLNINSQTFSVKYDINLPAEYFENTSYGNIIKYMKEKKINYSELFEMYYLRVKCNTHPFDEVHYYKFKELLLKNLFSLDKIETYGLFIALEAYCLRKLTAGDLRFSKELFDIFKIETDKNFYKFSETSPVTFMKFRNTYLTALRLHEFDWFEKFIEKYKDDIIESDRNTVLKIAYAYFSFEKKEFENTMKLLADLNPPQLFLKLDVRNLTLMAHYELNYFDSVLSQIDSYKHYLTGNNSLFESMRESNFRFLNSLNSLILIKEKNQKENLYDLKDKLKSYVGERRIVWLIDKIDEEIG
ncbi:MAG TPA: hypothetical protein PKA90_11275 [Ignavibacteria bacterium]|nr:hypothetical protein [Ignavibacteria bacterium]